MDQCPIAGGTFVMGDAHGDGLPADGELPLHTIDVGGYVIDETAVTTADFATFVDATGYRTSAERAGTSAVFGALVADESTVVGQAPATPWWLEVRGADWAHPEGPGSDIDTRSDHPVVHVSFVDAGAYCDWAGRSLPTEAQWEYAARGGLHAARFPWGDELVDGPGVRRCAVYDPDVWGAPFPAEPGSGVGVVPTTPARSFAPNGFGLWQTVGNVWEWCADRYDPRYYRRSPRHDPAGPDRGASRVLRGGSYLCDDSYCSRYRVSARSHNTIESSAGNTGFRTVARP
ncbi:formylglycine-generating enzyme family protein [Williamsia sp.]|uniref:formylglycine-generating enzyme family protein n=1 Tax=Williamsia sp. TaxID=1872085 RepID=UPI0025FC6CCC|nr:formylglycine-generating enzyme family protein [Williamsia sp.]